MITFDVKSSWIVMETSEKRARVNSRNHPKRTDVRMFYDGSNQAWSSHLAAIYASLKVPFTDHNLYHQDDDRTS